jgi:hypothetical protein
VCGRWVTAGQRGKQGRIERDGRADVTARDRMSELLGQPGRAQVRDRAVDEDLGPALPAQERPAPRGDQQVPALDLGSSKLSGPPVQRTSATRKPSPAAITSAWCTAA